MRSNSSVQATRTWQGEVQASITIHVKGWAKEKSIYNGQPISPGNNPAGHYTLMVWQNAQEFGCGFASSGQMDFLVFRYNPTGNLVGEMPYCNSNQDVIDDETTFVPNERVVGGEGIGVSDGGDAGEEGDGNQISTNNHLFFYFSSVDC